MLVIKEGENIFSTDANILVCPTNLKGVMGAGIARVIRDTCPKLYKLYQKKCKSGEHSLMVPFYYEPDGVLCLATKECWRNPTSLSLLQLAIAALNRWLKTLPKNTTVALPVLGGGNGQYKVTGNKKIKVSEVSREEILQLLTTTVKVPDGITVYLYT